MSKKSRILQVKNIGYNTDKYAAQTNLGKDRSPEAVKRNLQNYISPVQLQRFRQDIASWRLATDESERAFLPHRVKMQRIFIDTILNGHVGALMERRKDLTMLRDFNIVDEKGNDSEVLTQAFKSQIWLADLINDTLDALFFGYSLISIGDIESDEIVGTNVIPRWFVSPDRHVVGTYTYATTGIDFMKEPYADWHIYIPTRTDNGVSPCGYGLLYQIALYEIYLRNTLGFNGDYVELFGMPYRVGKTQKTLPNEIDNFEASLRNMGNAGYAIVDPTDEIAFLESSTTGTGWKSYDNLETRCEKKVSKLILGHADAMDSTPGKLGATGGEDNPVHDALNDKQTKDGKFVENIVNRQLLQKLRNLGLKDLQVPLGYKFLFSNNDEDEAFRSKEDISNLQTANIALAMKNAGLKMDAKYFEDRTGIPTTDAPEPVASPSPFGNEKTSKLSDAQKNKIALFYNKHKH